MHRLCGGIAGFFVSGMKSKLNTTNFESIARATTATIRFNYRSNLPGNKHPALLNLSSELSHFGTLKFLAWPNWQLPDQYEQRLKLFSG